MINFRKYLNRNVGNRVKEFRVGKNYTQKDFVAQMVKKEVDKLDKAKEVGYRESINPQVLSNIENANVHKTRNPYLLSKKQLERLPEFMKCTQDELIFGHEKEREDTIQLIILAIIMNGATYENSKEKFMIPFIDTRVTKKDCEEVYKALKKGASKELAKKKSEELVREKLGEFLRLSRGFIKNESADRIFQLCSDFKSIDEDSIGDEERRKYIDWFRINQSFFANTAHFENMKYLTNESDEKLEKSSNLLIKPVLFTNQHKIPLKSDYVSSSVGFLFSLKK